MYRNKKGFTIVELLIVIVVIGILAAITVVAFNGVQERARNNQTLSAVKEYTKLFQAYALDNQSYPNGASNYCIGTGYPANQCWDNRTSYLPSAVMETELKRYAPNLPNPSTKRVYRNSVDGSRAGILYVNNYTFRYQLEGVNTECALPGAVRAFNAGQSSGPECIVQLPDPTIQ